MHYKKFGNIEAKFAMKPPRIAMPSLGGDGIALTTLPTKIDSPDTPIHPKKDHKRYKIAFMNIFSFNICEF